MKKYLFVFFSITIFFSCSSEESIEQYDMEIKFKETTYIITKQEDLNNYVGDVLNDENAVILKSSFETLTDEKGEQFNAVIGHFNVGEKLSQKVVISLDKNNARNPSVQAFSFLSGCSMKCNPDDYCTKCGMTIHERCKRMTCSCNAALKPGSGCGTEISFP